MMGECLGKPHEAPVQGLDRRPPGHPEATPIGGGLYLGDEHDAADGLLRRRFGIRHMLSLTSEQMPTPRGVRLLHLPLGPDEESEIGRVFEPACEFIGESLSRGDGVLVFCEFGVGKSAGVLAAYLMRHRQCGPAGAVLAIRALRPVALLCPNPEILQALDVWGKHGCGAHTGAGRYGLCQPGGAESLEDIVAATAHPFDGATRQAADGALVLRPVLPGPLPEVPSQAEIPDDILKHKNKIGSPQRGYGVSKLGAAESILTLHCPECDQAFLDFTNCFALWCCSCGCAFCAYCQTSCRRERNDAHRHVMNCPYNIAPRKSIFADFRVFERAQNLRRIREIEKYLSEVEDGEERSAIVQAIKRDCEDLGIGVKATYDCMLV